MAINAYDQDEKSVEKSKFSTMFRLFKYLFKYKGRIAVVSVLMGIGTFVALINPLIIEQAIDKYISVKDIKGLINLCIVAALLNIIMVVCIKIRMFLMAKTNNKCIEEVREDLFTHIQSLYLPFFDSRPTGKILDSITRDGKS